MLALGILTHGDRGGGEERRLFWPDPLNRDSFDDTPRDLAFHTVVEAGPAEIRVAEEVLDVLKRNDLGDQVCSRRGAKRVTRQVRRQAGVLQVAVNYTPKLVKLLPGR